MARDAALFEAFERGEIPPTLRLYEWASPAITFGVNQRLPERLVQAAQQLRIPLFRRPTGGKAVLHGHDLTLALVANLPSAPDLVFIELASIPDRSTLLWYLRLCRHLGNWASQPAWATRPPLIPPISTMEATASPRLRSPILSMRKRASS
jgi:lipoate-protein ligase A